MSTALSVVFLYAASVIPTAKLALCFLTSLMPWIPLRERGGFVYALLSYAATGAICFFLIPNKLYFAAYILFFGCYGMIKLGIDSVIRDKLVAFAAKLILCNGLAALVIFGAGKLFSLDIIAQLPNYPLYIIIPAIEIFFIAYELVFTPLKRPTPFKLNPQKEKNNEKNLPQCYNFCTCTLFRVCCAEPLRLQKNSADDRNRLLRLFRNSCRLHTRAG